MTWQPMIPSHPPAHCPVATSSCASVAGALDAVGSRWTLLILRDLARTPMRFSDIAAINPTMSPTMLTNRLRHLEQAGIVERRTVPMVGSVYAVTEWSRGPVGRLLEALADLGATMLEHDPPVGGDGFDPVAALSEQMQLKRSLRHGAATVVVRLLRVGSLGLGDPRCDHPRGIPRHGGGAGQVGTASNRMPLPMSSRPRSSCGSWVATSPWLMPKAQGLLAIEGDHAAMVELLELLSFAT